MGRTSGIANFGASDDYASDDWPWDDGVDSGYGDDVDDGWIGEERPWPRQGKSGRRPRYSRAGDAGGDGDGRSGATDDPVGTMSPAERLMAILDGAVGLGGETVRRGFVGADSNARHAHDHHGGDRESDDAIPWALRRSQEIRKRGGTSQDLLDAMRSADHDLARDTDRRYRDFLVATGDGEGGDSGSGVVRGTVRLSFIARLESHGAWSVRFTVAAASGRPYVIKSLYEFVDAIDHNDRIVYGKGLAFIHSPEMFDERSKPMLALLRSMMESRDAAFASRSSWYYSYASDDGRELGVSQAQMARLLDLVGNGTVTVETMNDEYVYKKHTVRVFATDPMLGLRMERVNEGGEHGYRIRHAASILAFIQADGGSGYALVEHAPNDLSLHRCTPEFMRSRQVLETLCPPGEEPVLADEHRALFARTMLPQLMGGALHVNVPDELRRLRVDPCRGEFYLDRDPYGNAVCHAIARYGDRQMEVFGKDARGATDNAEFSRDEQAEELLRTAVGRYFTVPRALMVPSSAQSFLKRLDLRGLEDSSAVADDGSVRAGRRARRGVDAAKAEASKGVAHSMRADADDPSSAQPALPYVSGDDADAMLRLLTEGLQALGSVGAIYTTPRFDALLRSKPAKVEIGLSVRHNLIVFSAMSDEIPADQIGSVLDSYRRHRRYHRLADGTFLDLKDADLARLDDLTERLDIDEKNLDGGEVTLPGYEGFMLDAEQGVDKDESFVEYLDDFRVVDPARYQVPVSLAKVLRPYQRDGFRWLNALIDKNFGGILADEMGLGKSLQLISMLLSRREEMGLVGPALIVCPASLVYNWAGEFAKFAPGMRYETVAGTKSQRGLVIAKAAPVAPDAVRDGSGRPDGIRNGIDVAGGDSAEGAMARPSQAPAQRADDAPEVLITSYDLLRRDEELYRGRRFYCVALDEAQVIKNHSTKIAKAVKSIEADHRIALTGTPIENRLSELWSIFDFLMPGMLSGYRTFRSRYERPIFDGDEAVTARLKALVTPFILRRLKKDVLGDLPDKMEDVVTVRLEGEQRRLYGAHEKQLRLFLEGNEDVRTHRIQILSELTKLREICCDPRLLYENAKDASAKLAAIEELVESCMDGGHKMLIFSQFTSFLRLIAKRLDSKGVRYDEITGSTPKRERIELVERFNKDDTPVFLISLKAGGTGLNLTGATVVVHADPWWNAAAQNQATDRAHRIGQTSTVNVYQIVAQDTIEERIVQMQREKSKLAASIIGATGEAGTGLGELTRDDLLKLLG